MSLDTVLKIGKALRNSENSLKYFKYIQPCPIQKDKEGNAIYPICMTIPVNEDFTFNWDKVFITPENERDNLYFLNFTTSDSDSSPKKFGFGDICYTRKSEIDKTGKLKGVKDYGNFTFEKGSLKNAFLNGQKVFNNIKNEYLEKKIALLVSETEKIDEQDQFIKRLLKGYNENKPVLLTKKLEQFLNKVEPLLSYLKSEEEKIELFNFQNFFNSDLLKFNLLLLYAPAFEDILENKRKTISYFLENEKELKTLFVKLNLDKHLSKIKRFLNKETNWEDLSEAANNDILQFADFSVFIHFDFRGKHWYQYDKSISLITEKLNSELADITDMGVVPNKSIYRTLCSGDDSNDIQFPLFEKEKKYKSFAFKNSDEFQDFLYTDVFVKNPLRKLFGTKIDFYIFPALIGDDQEINGSDYIEFLLKKDETKIFVEPLFPAFLLEEHSKIRRFDFIFSDSSGNTTNDLIEISGINISNLRSTKERIERIAFEIYEERKKYFKTNKEVAPFSIEFSFKNVLGSTQSDALGKISIIPNSKYRSHLLKILPAIYTNSYYNDLILLPAFIQNVQYSIRAGDEKFSFLKFDFKYLLKIQNTQNDKFMEITNEESYQIGIKLGKLSKPLKKAINSFEKNYVGLLTRRISTKDDCIRFFNEINEKLIMHKKSWGQNSAQIAVELAQLPNSKYDKEKLAFGFFEGYFKYEANDKKKDFFVRFEKLLLDYEGNLELENELEALKELFQDIKN